MVTQRKQRPIRMVALVVVVVVLAMTWVGWDIWNRRQRPFDCGDGQRFAIDTRQFATQYSAYSLKLEASLNDKSKISLGLDPVQQEKLSEAMQSANEFRKYVAAGFNSCAITKMQYGRFGPRLQALDSVAREINALIEQPGLSDLERKKLATLIDEYSRAAQRLGTE